MRQFTFLLILIFLFVFVDCKKDTPTSPPFNDASWTAVNTGLTNTTVYALAVSGTNLFAGTDGLDVATDGGVWRHTL